MLDLAPSRRATLTHLPWIETRPGLPYFVTEHGEPWTPIGQNEAISWPEMEGLLGRRDLASVERYLRWNREHGVTCLRLMLEYAQGGNHYIEQPVGQFSSDVVTLWDDLFEICERVGLHILLTPYDTFFMWTEWHRHPYNRQNGGPAAEQREWLTGVAMRDAIKSRLAFASDRWGGSPALFAWDLWNEMHPAHAGEDLSAFMPFIDDVGSWLRAFETERHGRAHLQTVSIFGPELVKHPELTEPIFRHPALDFANTHLYEKGTIDDPEDTVAPALAVGRLMREAVNEARDLRPVFDSEHGPIHGFMDKGRTLPAAFDDEYFRHIQWAHLASGGAGGGMRWPNRDPHSLTPGMREAQQGLAEFLPQIDWTRFHRRNLSHEIQISSPDVACFSCGDSDQAVVWLLRTDAVGQNGTLAPASPLRVNAAVPGLAPGLYRITFWETKPGRIIAEAVVEAFPGEPLAAEVPGFSADLAIAIRRV